MEVIRRHTPIACFYRGGPPVDDDPAAVIHRALDDALVPYYPLAGRLREVEGRRLVVDCTGEWVLFVEADADVRLAELEAATGLRPPFPCLDRLLCYVEGSSGVLNCTLLLIQVTWLLCGGFAFAFRVNHVTCDAAGVAQFVSAVAEIARGLPAPTVPAAWNFNIVFNGLPPNLAATTFDFEVLTAALWPSGAPARRRSISRRTRVVSVVNFRHVPELGLPAGYYGNARACPWAVVAVTALRGRCWQARWATRWRWCGRRRRRCSDRRVRAVHDRPAGLLVLRGRPYVAMANLFLVSDNRHAGFQRVELGRGEPVYGVPAALPFGVSFFVHIGNGGGVGAVGAMIVRPRPAIDRFAPR
ncbi:hypothetical protein SETIT_3G056600v2 [Setaria italica]|uniref:Uncharacterized protein n=1 Tax=Setaria italica TaxID=4555 RepID=K3ZCC5_SETIT|nr:hypothetical protein SETIT_3G056600v2 [Setaria italica]